MNGPIDEQVGAAKGNIANLSRKSVFARRLSRQLHIGLQIRRIAYPQAPLGGWIENIRRFTNQVSPKRKRASEHIFLHVRLTETYVMIWILSNKAYHPCLLI